MANKDWKKIYIKGSKALFPIEVFEENVKRAHFQRAIWRRALEEPPNLDPTQYGWSRDGLEMRKQSPFNQSCFLPQSHQLRIMSINLFAALVHQRLHAAQVNVVIVKSFHMYIIRLYCK